MERNKVKKKSSKTTRQKNQRKKKIKSAFLWIFAGLISYGITDTIFSLVGLDYPHPIWLSFPMLTIFILILRVKLEEVLNQFSKKSKKKVVINYEDFK